MKSLNFFVFFCVLSFSFLTYSQKNETYPPKVLRKLERTKLLYTQGHYGLACWKAESILDQPEFEKIEELRLYQAMSLLHMQDRLFFFLRDPSPWEEASIILNELKSTASGKKILEAHIDELSELRFYLLDELVIYTDRGKKKKVEQLTKVIASIFENINYKKERKKKIIIPAKKEVKAVITSRQREKLLDIAKDEIGVPYVWGGTTSEGFDCSGFTSYVYSKADVKVARTANDQYESCKKIDRDKLKTGDLIFYNNGGESTISHVGIAIVNSDGSLHMIHASSSKGIEITNVDTSNYWQKKLVGFGTYVKD
jgi:hypothetical protein